MVIFFCEAATVGFSVYGPTFIQVLHGADPLLSGYVIGGIAAGWTALSFVVAGLKPRHEGWRSASAPWSSRPASPGAPMRWCAAAWWGSPCR
jgi:hypothetical protein